MWPPSLKITDCTNLFSILTKHIIYCRCDFYSFRCDSKSSMNFFFLRIENLFLLFSSVQSLSQLFVWLFVTPWTAAQQASLSITNSQSLFKLMSINR